MNKHKSGKINVTPVSLVDLKAEISRKKVLLASKQKQEIPQGIVPDNFKSIPIKKEHRLPKKENDEPSTSTEQQDKYSLQLEKSRKTLEAKAKLYDALKESAMQGKLKFDSCDGEKSECLVDFEKKAYDENSTVNINTDKNIPPPKDYISRRYDSDSSYSDEDDDDMVSYDDLVDKYKEEVDNVTYSHLRQGEVRQHGVGFYTFSKDAQERAAEMAKLKELHQEAEKAKKLAAEKKLKKDVELGQRLAKLRARKGLPDVSVMAAAALDKTTYNDSKPDELSNEFDISSMLRKMRDEAEDRAREKEARELKYLKDTGQIETGDSYEKQTLSDFSGKYRPGSKRAWDQDKPVIMNAPRK